jgi:AraC-like DNA-binding protein
VRGYPGDVISTNPGEVHDGRPLGHPTRRWSIVHIDVETMSRLIGRDGRAPALAIRHPVMQDSALTRSLRRLFSRLERWNSERRGATGALACEEALVQACVQLMERHGSTRGTTPVPSERLERVRERLADQSRVPSLADLATMTGLSRYQVLRRFEQAYGIPPHTWVLRQRAERARLLIRAGRTLAAAALECGFADQSHMTRVFVRQFGFTPGAWQKASRPRNLVQD